MVCVVNMYRVYKAYFTQVSLYRNPDVYIYVKNQFTVTLCITMPLQNFTVCVGCPFLRRNVYTHSYKGQNIVVCKGCLFSQRDAYIYCEIGHPDAYIYVNIGIGVPIFA